MWLHRNVVVRIINQTPDVHGADCLSPFAGFLVQSSKYSDGIRYHFTVWTELLHQPTAVCVITYEKTSKMWYNVCP
jgi:hypothetical protein